MEGVMWYVRNSIGIDGYFLWWYFKKWTEPEERTAWNLLETIFTTGFQMLKFVRTLISLLCSFFVITLYMLYQRRLSDRGYDSTLWFPVIWTYGRHLFWNLHDFISVSVMATKRNPLQPASNKPIELNQPIVNSVSYLAKIMFSVNEIMLWR